jgi:hypothetical protein
MIVNGEEAASIKEFITAIWPENYSLKSENKWKNFKNLFILMQEILSPFSSVKAKIVESRRRGTLVFIKACHIRPDCQM